MSNSKNGGREAMASEEDKAIMLMLNADAVDGGVERRETEAPVEDASKFFAGGQRREEREEEEAKNWPAVRAVT